jgi:hypothetical protein
MNDKITLSAWFEPEEIPLMGKCLEAVASGHFINDHTLGTLTGWYIETFKNLSNRFNETDRVSQEEYEVVFQAVMQLVGYPIHNPHDLEPRLGIRPLYLSWFWYRLMPIKHEWQEHADDDAIAVTRAWFDLPA